MNRLIHHGVLLAQDGRLDELARGVQRHRGRYDGGDAIVFLLIAAALIAAIGLLSYAMRLMQRHGYVSPLRLFFGLCRAHRLQWSQAWLLWRVARLHRLRDPARLFLEPERLDATALGRLRTRRTDLRALRDRLFGEEGGPDQ